MTLGVQPAVSVIVISHNTRDLTMQCLHSLSVFENIQTIVVDTGSSDGTPDAVKSLGLHLISASVSTGYAAASHLGVKQASSENLIICNADTVFQIESIEPLISALNDKGVGIAGPRLINSDGTLQQSWARFPDVASEWSGALDRSEVDDPRSGTHMVSWVGGACIAMKRSTWDVLNGYNPDIMFYGEDSDLCWRARQTGLRTVFVADAIVTHHGGQSSTSRSPLWLRRHLLVARLRDLRTVHGPLMAVPAQIIAIARFIIWVMKGFGTPGAHRN